MRRGRSPSMYFSWTDCSAQVTGFSRAEFKSFKDYAEVEAYLAK
jgi:ribonuclease HI